MASDEKVLAEIDCFHRFYRFRQAASGSADLTRFEAWLDYKQAIFRRDEQRCSQCGQVRPLFHLDVRPGHPGMDIDQMGPDNLVSICVFCQSRTSAGLIRPGRHSHWT